MVIDGWYFSTDIHFRIFPKIAGRVSSRKPQELTHLASAFKTQAESELSENRPEPGRLSWRKKKQKCHEPSPILGNLAISLENGMI